MLATRLDASSTDVCDLDLEESGRDGDLAPEWTIVWSRLTAFHGICPSAGSKGRRMRSLILVRERSQGQPSNFLHETKGNTSKMGAGERLMARSRRLWP
jgi:hypothetical protein